MDSNKALVNAVHAVANARLKAAAQNISRAANAAKNGQIAQFQTEIESLKRTMTEAGQAARTAESIEPSLPAAPAALMAEANAVNALIRNIGNGRYNNKLKNPFNNLSSVIGYNATRKININRAVAARRTSAASSSI
jgi:hypothetical protein